MRLIALLLFSLVTFWCGAAGADTVSADEFARQGIEALGQEDFKRARALFLKAWESKKAYDIAGNLASTEIQLGLWVEAAEHLDYVSEHMPVSAKPVHREIHQEHVDEVMPHVSRLLVQTNVPGARIMVAGKERGETPLSRPLYVLAGEVKVQAMKSGYQLVEKKVMAPPKAQQELMMTLLPMPTMQPPVPLIVEPNVVPSASDGPDARLVAGLVTGGLAVIGFGVGIGGSVAAAGHARDAEVLRGDDPSNACNGPTPAAYCADLAGVRDSYNSAQGVAVTGYVLGSVLAGTSAGLLIWWATDDEDTQENAFNVVPTFTQHGAGLTLTGVWQ